MKIVEKMFFLQGEFPFDTLSAGDLLTVATATKVHRYQPSYLLCEKYSFIQHLYVCINGYAVDDHGNRMPNVLGATILLTGKPSPFTIKAGPSGYTAISLPRGKFLTIINECPVLLKGFFQMPLFDDYHSKVDIS